MAPNDRDDTSKPLSTNANPLYALHRLAEAQMTNMLQSLGLPSAIIVSEHDDRVPNAYRRRVVDTYQQAAADEAWRRGASSSGNDGNGAPNKADRDTAKAPTIRCPYSPYNSAPDDDASPDHAPHAPPSAFWLARYLRRSPYSPAHLESDPRTAPPSAGSSDPSMPDGPMPSSRWRHAFEDLLAAQSGRAMGEYTDGEESLPARGPQGWIARCVERWSSGSEEHQWRQGSWGPRRWQREERREQEHGDAGKEDDATEAMRRLQRLIIEGMRDEGNAPAPEHKAGRGPATELDAYEQLLGRDAAHNAMCDREFATRETPSTRASAGPASMDSSSNAQSSVVATMTSTQRVMLPDGTVRTRQVLRRRFADGREEDSNETVSQVPDGPQTQQLRTAATDKAREGHGPVMAALEQRRRETGPRDGERKQGGWFWS